MSGAAPLSGKLMKQISAIFPNAVVGQGYGKIVNENHHAPFLNENIGLTETCATLCFLQPDRKLGTIGGVGELVPGVIAKVVKSDGTLASEGEQGELVVKAPSLALGYYENAAAYVKSNVSINQNFC